MPTATQTAQIAQTKNALIAAKDIIRRAVEAGGEASDPGSHRPPASHRRCGRQTGHGRLARRQPDSQSPRLTPGPDRPVPQGRGFRGVSTKTVTFATAFEGITVQLDQTAEQPGRGAHFAGLREFMGGPGHIPGLVQRVHMMSSHAFGEIRSYVLDEARCLRLAGPCHGGEWAEMDNEVARVLAATLHPYKLTAGGSIEE